MSFELLTINYLLINIAMIDSINIQLRTEHTLGKRHGKGVLTQSYLGSSAAR